jgi:hypothetical protein
MSVSPQATKTPYRREVCQIGEIERRQAWYDVEIGAIVPFNTLTDFRPRAPRQRRTAALKPST